METSVHPMTRCLSVGDVSHLSWTVEFVDSILLWIPKGLVVFVMYTVEEEYGQVHKDNSYLVRDSLIHKSESNQYLTFNGFYYSNTYLLSIRIKLKQGIAILEAVMNVILVSNNVRQRRHHKLVRHFKTWTFVLTPPTGVRHLFITVVGIILCHSQIEMLVNSLTTSFF